MNCTFSLLRVSRLTGALAAACLAGLGAPQAARAAEDSKEALVPRWERLEITLQSAANYANAAQEATLTATFLSPLGETNTVRGFWDGGRHWKIRFAPNAVGKWTYQTTCSDKENKGLNGQSGQFLCTSAGNKSRFAQHGPVRVSPDGRYLIHEDRTPFFWMGDTAWNGALLSTTDEWDSYIRERTRQKFTAVQFVATQFRAAPKGDRLNELAYSGNEKISINPAFFQRMDAKLDALNRAGLLGVPVMLWAIEGGGDPKVNPGVSLPEEQAVLLARYMVARWGANPVVWILAGDGNYFGGNGAKWKRIGRAVFGEEPHAPVIMHPQGMHWIGREFKDEKWMDIVGYQSGHGDDEKTLRWLSEGPLTTAWTNQPFRPVINLEPPYENHIAYQSKKPHTPESVRRAIYWSLLNGPTAGVTYGGHGVWGWDDGSKPPTDHPSTGTPLPWKKALTMPGAEQMAHLAEFFTSIDWWRLRPTPGIVVNQPGRATPAKFVTAASTDLKDLVLVYIPEERTVEVLLDALPPSPTITWFNPRTGEKSPAVAVVTANTCQFPTPSEGDWIMWMKSSK
ncbi:MAG TPA: DUF4038 domain-containing protein [Verrucomicrobiae bacterium]